MMEEIKCILSTKELLDRVKTEIPAAKFCTRYFREDEEFMTLLRQYQKQSFVYLLVNTYMDKKCVIYVGKSSDQYNRVVMHKSNFEFEELYLFMVPVKKQKEIEEKMIGVFAPLYNKACNEDRLKEMSAIGLKYDEYKSYERIREDIQLLLNNHKMQPIMFFLPQKYVLALKDQARKEGVDINEYLSTLLEKEIPEESVLQSVRNCNFEEAVDSEVVTAKQYAQLWGKSVEQIKVHCRNGRIPAYKQKRDWLIPRSAPYPEDRRKIKHISKTYQKNT